MWFIIILGFLGGIYLFLLFLLKSGWDKWAKTPHNQPIELPSLSVVVAARNEASNLKKFLPSILSQDYPDFELIVVLDRCEDDSLEVLQKFQEKYSHLQIVKIEEKPAGWAGKKYALAQGIGVSQHEFLLFTDADCWVGDAWLRHYGQAFAEGKEIILGIGRYEKEDSFLNTFIRYETFYTALQYIGWAAWGEPYMAVGRNLGYTKEVFQKNRGFSAFQDSLSGDDDLFVNAYGKYHTLGVVLDKKAHTVSVPKSNWKEWFQQKNRHVSASHKYSIESKVLLGIFHLSHMFIYLGTILGLIVGLFPLLTLSLFLGRIVIACLLIYRPLCQFGAKDLVYTYPALDLFFFLYNLFIIPIGLLKRPSWKK